MSFSLAIKEPNAINEKLIAATSPLLKKWLIVSIKLLMNVSVSFVLTDSKSMSKARRKLDGSTLLFNY